MFYNDVLDANMLNTGLTTDQQSSDLDKAQADNERRMMKIKMLNTLVSENVNLTGATPKIMLDMCQTYANLYLDKEDSVEIV